MPAKKTLTKKPLGKRPVGLTSAIGPKATTILVICVMASAMAVAARQREQAAKAKASDELMMMAADGAPSVVAAPAKKTARTRAVVPAMSTATTGTIEPAVMKTSGVTLTGCLERTDDGFRLTDTEGENAPKSRSWKSGFLKKGSAAISVSDPSKSLRLANQVGHRVTISGTLMNRDLRAAAIHQSAGVCK